MGASTTASCSTCRYHVFLRLGGGMANHRTYAAWPVHCEDCSATTTANFKSVSLGCEECGGLNVVPVTDRREWWDDGTTTIKWSNLSLTNGHYRCPKCSNFTLRFLPGMMLWN